MGTKLTDIEKDQEQISAEGVDLTLIRWMFWVQSAPVMITKDYLTIPKNWIVGDLQLRLLDLESLIKVKEETASDKDLAIISILRQTLKEKQRP
ncbi:hypothetical protein D1AOALGA4SA_6204 [Olavius algarvensis Delta 1 endosymbiont]|nr:hypothetical protein D1AOALGA4SA_6204 [Olavius algarvensis Delta 1 endosymbiont]